MERASTTAACCIPQANLMKVMSIASVVSYPSAFNNLNQIFYQLCIIKIVHFSRLLEHPSP